MRHASRARPAALRRWVGVTIGSLFSGIGGLELGLERAGLGPALWQVEREPFCRRVLARHWPDATRYDDVCTIDATKLVRVNVICGGFPCQNLSSANVKTRVGLAGSSSGLWREFARIVAGVDPRWVVVENVADAWREWVPTVRRDLGRLGYASVSVRLRACDVGAPVKRERCFVVAQSYRHGESAGAVHAQTSRLPSLASVAWQDWGQASPRALGVADGIPHVPQRLRAVGNAVVPAVAEVIGRAIAQCA